MMKMAPADAKSQRIAVLFFIEEVKKRTLLWDPNDDDYMDRESTANAWQEIANELSSAGHDVPGDLKIKWKCLRDTYRRIERLSHDKKDKKTRWPYFKRLCFLQQVPLQVKRRSKSSRCPDDGEFLDSEFQDEETQQPYEYIKCEESSDNEVEMPPIETELDTLSKGDDYDLMFLKSLAPYFKSLEPMRQLIVRNKIQDILLNELAAQQTLQNNKGL